MGQYISKSALVEEIERRLEKIANASSEHNRELSAIHGAQQCELINLVQYIDTLEVKDTDLDFEQELYKAFGQVKDFTLCMCIARHFYELGLKAQKGE